jgi:hypothetical protein
MAIVGAAFLLAVGRALARIHVEHDHLRRSQLVHLVNPLAGQIGKSGKVLRPAQPLLAGRGGRASNCPVADNPAHRRIAAQPVGVVDVLIAGQPPEDPLAQHASGLALLVPGQRRNRLSDAFDRAIDEILDGRVLPFDRAAAETAVAIAAKQRQIGRSVEIRDVQIAGIAAAPKATLATPNTRHFENLGVILIDPGGA